MSSDLKGLAKAVESAVFQSLLNAESSPEREDYWFRHAEKLETKFKNHPDNIMKKHYSEYIYGTDN